MCEFTTERNNYCYSIQLYHEESITGAGVLIITETHIFISADNGYHLVCNRQTRDQKSIIDDINELYEVIPRIIFLSVDKPFDEMRIVHLDRRRNDDSANIPNSFHYYY